MNSAERHTAAVRSRRSPCSPVAANQRHVALGVAPRLPRRAHHEPSQRQLSDLRAKARNFALLRSKQFQIVSATSKLCEWLDHVLKTGAVLRGGATFLLISMITRVNQDAGRGGRAMMIFLAGA